jgi:hypothetical protein
LVVSRVAGWLLFIARVGRLPANRDAPCPFDVRSCVDFGGDALLFAWSWSAQAPLASAASLPSSVCVAAWAHDAASGAIAASEVTCVDVGTSSTIIAGRGNTASYIADKRSSQLVVPEVRCGRAGRRGGRWERDRDDGRAREFVSGRGETAGSAARRRR